MCKSLTVDDAVVQACYHIQYSLHTRHAELGPVRLCIVVQQENKVLYDVILHSKW